MDFDSAAWRAEQGNFTGVNARQGLVAAAALVLKPGTPRAEVEAALGVPDGRGEARDVYALGRSSVGPSYETLIVEYDAAGRVTGHRLGRS